MVLLRRTLLLVLLVTAPFQAAFGATGLLCGTQGHHRQQAAAAPHGHDAAMASLHGHGAGAAEQPASVDMDWPESHDATGKCSICSECCSPAAVIPAVIPSVISPDTALRVSTIVDPGITSHAGDGLFRPPRTTSD